MKWILALFLAVPVVAHADVAQPAPGTWGVGMTGFDSVSIVGTPNVRYVATDKTTLELTPLLQWSGLRQGLTVNNSQTYELRLDILHKIGTYRDTNLSWLVEPTIGYAYGSSYGPLSFYTKIPQPQIGIGAGLELEHFFQPNLSVSARTLLDFNYVNADSYSSATGSSRGSSKSWGIRGQALSMHYYFTDDGSKLEATPADRGRWALGWQGFGLIDGFAQPSLKYVLNDRWAVEAVPSYRSSHSNVNGILNHTDQLLVPVDFERTLVRSHGVELSWLVQPAFGYTYSKTVIGGTAHTQTYFADIGTGLEIEYFFIPDLSVGARGLLIYQNSHGSNYAPTGYAGQSIGNTLVLGGQVLSARWYFGAPPAK